MELVGKFIGNFEGKWDNIIPFSPESLKIYEARSLALEIEECYKNHNIHIKIKKRDYNPLYEDGFIFIVKLKKKMSTSKLRLSNRQTKLISMHPFHEILSDSDFNFQSNTRKSRYLPKPVSFGPQFLF